MTLETLAGARKDPLYPPNKYSPLVGCSATVTDKVRHGAHGALPGCILFDERSYGRAVLATENFGNIGDELVN